MNKVLGVAIVIRLLVYVLAWNDNMFCSTASTDAFYFYHNLWPIWVTPAYLLFLKIPFSLVWQFAASVLAVGLMYRLSPVAGWLWAFYPISVFSWYQYNKEAMMIPALITVLYLLRNRPIWKYVAFFAVWYSFQTMGLIAITGNHSMSKGMLHNFTEFWINPGSQFLVTQSLVVFWLYVPLYLFIVSYWARHVQWEGVDIVIIITMTIIYTIVNGTGRYHESIMPLIALWYGRHFPTLEGRVLLDWLWFVVMVLVFSPFIIPLILYHHVWRRYVRGIRQD